MQRAFANKREDAAAVADDLRAFLGDRLSTVPGVCRQHGEDLTWHGAAPPDAVAFPRSVDEICRIVRLCADRRVPVVPFGAGTSLEGHVMAVAGGICMDLSGMNAILEVNAEDMDCRVQAGVTRKQLNAHLRDTGLFFPVDPGADATIGGMAATRASGTNAVRYGTMRENVLNLTAVMPDGSVVRTKGRARKSSAGYDLTALLVGSEGTLGVIAEAGLRLHGVPESVAGGVCPFPDLKSACDAAIMTVQCGIPAARIEILDALQIAACNRHSKLSLPETPALFVEFHGSAAGVREQSEAFAGIAAECGGGPFSWSDSAEERSALWTARHNALWAAKELRPGAKLIVTDACVPVSRLADCVVETQKDIAAAGLTAPIVGHAGDGNFHLFLLVDTDDSGETGRAQELCARLALRAIDMGGTCTGEHGIGNGKTAFMEKEHGCEGVALMRAVKAAIDPHGIMNPGKILP